MSQTTKKPVRIYSHRLSGKIKKTLHLSLRRLFSLIVDHGLNDKSAILVDEFRIFLD